MARRDFLKVTSLYFSVAHQGVDLDALDGWLAFKTFH